MILNDFQRDFAQAARSAGFLERAGQQVRCILALDDRRKLPFAPSEAEFRIEIRIEIPKKRAEREARAGLVSLLCAAEAVPAFRASALCKELSFALKAQAT